MGSLGFLTPFDFNLHEKILNEVFEGNVPILLRTRLSCQITQNDGESPVEFTAINTDSKEDDKTKPNIGESSEVYQTLNEVVIDRGPNSYLSNLDLYVNDRFITKVQGDGKSIRHSLN